ncbi:hypothetical protein HMPREF9080_02539 [Cardiobacterium valvarum F0432]|uniref:Uncharacterized protein n=1 Tax=Cardiobacterium valvarum F0432 TaxID=797473 RepID=G9ZIC9_9GAMM|nr:hypothetical protein HMPREF9080_02539 [Cardiobacterium valvarum F0432]
MAGTGQRDAVLLAVFVAQRPVAAFEGFGGGARGAQGGGDFAGDLFAADGQGSGVHGLVVQPQHDVSGAGAEVNGADAEFAFVRAAGGVGRGEAGIDDLFDFDAGFAHTLAEVVHGGAAGADDVDAGVEFVGGHAFGVGDAFVTIDDELLFEDVQQGLPAFVGEVARAHDGVDDVVVADAAVSDMGLAIAVDAEDVLAADADDGAVDFDAGFLFGDGDCLTDGGGGGGDVGDDACLDGTTSGNPAPQHFKIAVVAADFGDGHPCA